MQQLSTLNEVPSIQKEKERINTNISMARILQTKRELEIIFDALTVPVFLIDRERVIIRANKAFARLMGVDIGSVVGKKCHDLFHKGNPPENCPCDKILEGNAPVFTESEIGRRHFKIISSPVFDDSDEVFAYVHVLSDITEIKEADERIKDEARVSAALLDVAVAVSSLTSIDEVMNKVSVTCRMVFNSSSCMTWLLDKGTDAFRPVAASGLSPENLPFFNAFKINKNDMLLINGLVTNKKVFTVEDVNESPWVKKEYLKPLGVVSLLAAPIVSMGKVCGILFVGYGEPRRFSSRDASILHGISHQVSVAVANAGMYQDIMSTSMELSHRIETIQTMHEIDMSILSSIERDVILETAVTMVSRVIPCDRGAIATVDMERRAFIYVAGFNVSLSKNTVVPFTDTSATEVVRTGRPQYYDNLRSLPHLLPLEEGLMKAGSLSQVRVPLVDKGEVVGMLSIGSNRASAFTPDDLFTLERLAAQITVALENSMLVEGLKESNLNIEQTMDATVLSLSKLAEFRDPETGFHLERMSHYSRLLAEECLDKKIYRVDESFVRDIFKASVLHDIGKVGVKDSILLKPGKMTVEEFEEIKRHTTMGGQIIEAAEGMLNFRSFLTMAKDVAYYHHEKYDGSGYPKGLKGEDIPLSSRIVALADFYDALTSHRVYRNWVKSHKEVKGMILEEEGRHFDPTIVAAFLKREKEFLDINKRFPDK